ncbi:hypothetical protein F511_28580 [Dorcoceras hygrometricum]|uniref:Uncharacterized protein n=1 Tax=Dorcoceras hygrometricum TaxID=472368 RepID=A0A2Z7BPW0_9LAMI|nr:hypothetical protein F511_28580 [Dorcoceras hygrometricum]
MPPQSQPFAEILSTATMQRHTDYGFLPKTQPDLNPAVHVSPYRRSQYNITGIAISFRIADDHLGSRPQPYILLYFNSSSRTRDGDTPDAPRNHLGTRGPSSSPVVPTCTTKIGCHRGFRMKGSGDGPRTPA